jgi:hypothetical protein
VFVYPLIVARQRLSKHVHAATRNCWRRRLLCGPCRIKGKYVINTFQNFFLSFLFTDTVSIKTTTASMTGWLIKVVQLME